MRKTAEKRRISEKQNPGVPRPEKGLPAVKNAERIA